MGHDRGHTEKRKRLCNTGSAGVEHGALGLVRWRPEVRVVHHGSPVERLPDDVIVRDAQRILGDDAWGRALERRVFLWQRMGQIVRLRGGDRQLEKGHEHCESDDCDCGGLQPLPPAASFDPPVDRLQPKRCERDECGHLERNPARGDPDCRHDLPEKARRRPDQMPEDAYRARDAESEGRNQNGDENENSSSSTHTSTFLPRFYYRFLALSQ